MDYNKTDFIIERRKKMYEEDIEAMRTYLKKHKGTKSDIKRVEQDSVIVQELERILTGKGLYMLSWVDKI
ncbi:MAG TPA: hypothetical protein VL854_06125 [Nitrososphaeraceae archaeon]|nr:hypothetical protein [Nitrososphaeraceae archaeon]